MRCIKYLSVMPILLHPYKYKHRCSLEWKYLLPICTPSTYMHKYRNFTKSNTTVGTSVTGNTYPSGARGA